MSDVSARLYLGRLPQGVLREDITDLFRGLGRIIDVRILNGFGFVEFDDPRDAELAVRDFDGTMFMGDRLIVQFAKQPLRRDDRGPRDRDREREPYGGPRGYDRYDARPPRRGPRRGLYRIIVFNLPPGTSWQDLKDVGREYGQVVYSDINPSRPDEGALEFDHRDDYERALAKIEGTELRGALLRAEPDGEPPAERERSPVPTRWGREPRDDGAYPPREGDRWGRDTRPPRDYRDERPPPPMRDDRAYDREPLPPRDDDRAYDREPLPPRDDDREPLPPRDDDREPLPPRDDDREPLPPRDDDREPLPPRDDDREPLPPRDEPEPLPPRDEAPAPPADEASAPPADEASAPTDA
ncbi:hypothetical protein MBRA1_003745 [Malassezia brasiliensis]|uniref:RRM domain-containing protein n=1 Tax=Malassezia brasiliensis TaxID=1821822 RepID=A0AAF0IRE0_9BASI|nr:hypothetical protein MBRA1_003745 [Malassezia brasiliensis]